MSRQKTRRRRNVFSFFTTSFFSSLYRYHKIITLLPAGKFNINRLLGLTFNSSEDCLFDFFSLYLVLLSTVITVTEINELPASYPNCFVIPKITCFRNRHRYRIFYSIWQKSLTSESLYYLLPQQLPSIYGLLFCLSKDFYSKFRTRELKM